MNYSHALVRSPSRSYAHGLTQSTEGPPDLAQALLQHRRYCQALRDCGLQLTELAPDEAFPDGTFVEDTALLFADFAVLTGPGAPSRRGETASVLEALRAWFERIETIEAPATLDGGDVCVAGRQVFIGLSARTNEAGAAQLGRIVGAAGCTASTIDIRGSGTLLHLKSGLTYLGEELMILSSDAPRSSLPQGFDIITLESSENYAANCLCINGHVLMAAGYPALAKALRRRGREVLELEMSEFRKMDGGLTCLSLRRPSCLKTSEPV